MAQLVTTKEKYGVSVAARIDPQLAHQISDKADRLGVSMSKMVGMLISSGFNPQTPIINDNQEDIDRLENEIDSLNDEILNLGQLYTQTAAEFIDLVSSDDQDKLNRVEAYNEILEEKKETE